MLTVDELKSLKPGVFASGITTDDENGINMTGSGMRLRWVAVRGLYIFIVLLMIHNT